MKGKRVVVFALPGAFTPTCSSTHLPGYEKVCFSPFFCMTSLPSAFALILLCASHIFPSIYTRPGKTTRSKEARQEAGSGLTSEEILQHYEAIKAQGIDEIYCLSVNDAFVMRQWGLKQECPEEMTDTSNPLNPGNFQKTKLIPDGACLFTRGMGMSCTWDSERGFGERSWRYRCFTIALTLHYQQYGTKM
jgi:peroxiredoxin